MSSFPDTIRRSSRPCTEPSKCRSCGADILWAKTRTGKNMPVDAVPDMREVARGGGGFVLSIVGGEYGHLAVEKFYGPKHGDKRNRYTAHWATCPQADEHRKPRESGGGE